MRSSLEKPFWSWLDLHAWKCGLVLAAGCVVLAWGLHWMVAEIFPGLAFSRDRPPVFWETLRVPVLFFTYLAASLAAAGVFLRKSAVSSGSVTALAVLALGLAMAVRWATPDMALDLSPAPDALHYSALASRLTSLGQWTIPIGPHELPSRFSPATSLLLALIQWMRPEHLGTGIGIIWLTGGLSIALLWGAGAWAFSRRIGVVAALLLASSPSYGHYTRLIMSEVPWSLFILLALAGIYLARERRGVLFAGGFLLAVGMLFKPPHVAVVTGVGASYVVYMFFHPSNRWRNAFLIGAGFCAGIVPWFLYNRLVLGGWILSGYQIFDSNQCAVDAVFGFRYLFSPPIEKGFTGNLIYYPMALLGLEPRMSRMLFTLPVSLLVLAGLWFRFKRQRPAEPLPAEGRWLLWGSACAGMAYISMFMFLHWQDSRYLLPVLPLICLWAAVSIDPFIVRLGPNIQRWLLVLMILVLASMGASILQVEIEGRRQSAHETWSRLPAILAEYDVLATDEDPLVLGFYGLWTSGRIVVPVIPAGADWPGEDPQDLRRRTGVYQAPYGGLEDALKPHLDAGRRVAIWLRHPRAHRALLDFLSPEYDLKPWTADIPNGYRLIRSESGSRKENETKKQDEQG